MQRPSMLFKLVTMLVFLALALGLAAPVSAQTDDGIVPDGGTGPAVEEDAPFVEKGVFTPGASSSVDAGRSYLYVPFVAGQAENGVAAAAPAATWVTVVYDDMCAFPNNWSTYDYNGTGQNWVYSYIEGWCTGQPSGITNAEYTYMSTYFDLSGALSARARFRFKMQSEAYFDFLRFEYSCNSGKTNYGVIHAYSGTHNWSVATVGLDKCKGYSSVMFRIAFVTDRSVLSTMAPAIDYFWVEKYQ